MGFVDQLCLCVCVCVWGGGCVGGFCVLKPWNLWASVPVDCVPEISCPLQGYLKYTCFLLPNKSSLRRAGVERLGPNLYMTNDDFDARDKNDMAYTHVG